MPSRDSRLKWVHLHPLGRQLADEGQLAPHWGANNNNFNYEYNTRGHNFGNSWGGGQAECFITQHSGVFGFVSTPYSNSYTVLKNLLNEPDKIWGTDDKINNNLVNPIDKKEIALNTINKHDILYNKVKKAN